MYYDRILDRFREHNPSGFHVIVEFAASSTEDLGGKGIHFTIASGLDPWRKYGQKTELPKDFKTEDKLDDVVEAHSSEYWQGENAVVEANKKKYLRKPSPGRNGK